MIVRDNVPSLDDRLTEKITSYSHEQASWCWAYRPTKRLKQIFFSYIRSWINYLFCAVFTIVRTSCTISSSLSWSLLLAASTKQHERWSSRSWRLVDLTSQMTAKFCWMTEIQYLSFSIISITLSNVLLAFFSEMRTLLWFFFIV